MIPVRNKLKCPHRHNVIPVRYELKFPNRRIVIPVTYEIKIEEITNAILSFTRVKHNSDIPPEECYHGIIVPNI
jgi:hypothetical protein